jgi:hypothetical protein
MSILYVNLFKFLRHPWLKNGKTKRWRLEEEHLSKQWPEKYYLLIAEAELQANWKCATGKGILKFKISSTIFSKVLREKYVLFNYLEPNQMLSRHVLIPQNKSL